MTPALVASVLCLLAASWGAWSARKVLRARKAAAAPAPAASQGAYRTAAPSVDAAPESAPGEELVFEYRGAFRDETGAYCFEWRIGKDGEWHSARKRPDTLLSAFVRPTVPGFVAAFGRDLLRARRSRLFSGVVR